MDAIFLIVRLVVGFGMAAHGAQKLFGWFEGGGIKGTGAYLESLGFRPGVRFALLDGTGEFFGGILTALGFLSPIGPALIVSVMLVAIRTVHKGHGFFVQNNGRELPVLYITGAVAVALAGPDLFSLDYVLDLNSAIPQSVTWLVSAVSILGAVSTLAMRRPAGSAVRAPAVRRDVALNISKGL